MYLRANPGGGRWCAFGLLVTAAMASVCPAWAQVAGSPPEGAATITQLTGRVDVMRDSIHAEGQDLAHILDAF